MDACNILLMVYLIGVQELILFSKNEIVEVTTGISSGKF